MQITYKDVRRAKTGKKNSPSLPFLSPSPGVTRRAGRRLDYSSHPPSSPHSPANLSPRTQKHTAGTRKFMPGISALFKVIYLGRKPGYSILLRHEEITKFSRKIYIRRPELAVLRDGDRAFSPQEPRQRPITAGSTK